ncbi:MobA/MobL family protein [Sulfitobacter sp. M57]|uniref:MobQ family relaxase n=1 Tax=unclassified Sulfitobacter TaxID=196795 RepID=UPI0023E347CC|nr:MULTISPECIES: MobQ family relaxase [unclassified Sulfitobacter]MDF3511410.1 MobA/MobL family protein [Sulfitobacter sp. M57]MDF3515301.1 MobA/MobL family protein [Sulfitobacter sp. M36]MDF3416653.1 MobA/MobL family protein [Sulfitobacter sp. KE5]MDF3424146.1 MobA/MobL family protein [Sulfitobacter sp. KE43]MDF3435226.1 MobA/MobL family protein [Sulfitobacter sp. KE42]
MAIYHLSAKVISRAGGRSSVAAAAYRTAGRLRDDRQGLEHDYSRKGGVVHAEIMTPENAPDWMRDRDQLWNAVEAVEKRRDAQLAREIEVALPRELDRSARLELLRGFVGREFVDRGMIADVAVHEGKARDGQSQPHAHIMLTMRELTGDGFGKKDRSWNAPDLLMGWREAWAREANGALERAGRSEQIDHRSLDVQRAEAEQQAERARGDRQHELALEREKKVIELSREPEPKIGPSANAQEKRGIATERGDAFRAAQDRNAQRQELGWRQLELRLELMERGRAFIASARERLDQLWGRAEAAMSRIKERVMGEVERPQAGAERGDLDHRRAAVLGRDVDRPEAQAPDVGRERVAPDDPDRDRRDAILGRQRDTGQERDAAAAERDIAARDGEGRDQGRRESILGRGRDSAPERGQGRDRDRDRDRER